MKKLLLVALALLVSTASFAQFRTAPREVGAPMQSKSLDFGMASNFTVTTIDNQTITLQNWLDSGYLESNVTQVLQCFFTFSV